MRLIFAVKTYYYIYVSIHASVKDATHVDPMRYPKVQVSIHASVKDATSTSFYFDCVFQMFQSTHL